MLKIASALVFLSGQIVTAFPAHADVESYGAKDSPRALSHQSGARFSAGYLEEVVVSAERRSENLQNVPIAVTALTGAELLNAGVTQTVSLSLAVPGLMYMQGANAATPFIRGVGTAVTSVGSEASVATYVDGVYISSIQAAVFELNNVDRVEVLKGPQGTLFGRNATGGVVHIITRDPSVTPSVDARVSYGNYDTTDVSLYGTSGVGEKVAIDFAAYGHDQAGGWGTNRATGQPTFTHHDFGGRAKLLWLPDERTRIVVAADYNQARNEDGLGYHVISPAVAADGVTGYGGFYDTYDDPNDFSDTRQAGLSLTVDHDLAPGRLVSITSWRNVDGFMQFDQDATPLAFVTAKIGQHNREFTQEVQLVSSPAASTPWIAGLYYFDDFSAYDPLALQGRVAAPFDERQNWSAQKSKSYAAFGQATSEVATNTRLTFGARYTKDDRELNGSTLGRSGTNSTLLAAASQNAAWSKVTWRMALEYQFAPDIMGYVSADRGFKSGSFNLTSFAAAPVRPETLDAYQAGIKTEFADHRLRVNLAAFYYDYKDMQLQRLITGSTTLVNAEGAVLRGVDVDLALVPINGLTVRAGVERMSGRYCNFPDAPYFYPIVDSNGKALGGNTQGAGNAAGLDTVRTPKRTANISAEYRVAAAWGSLQFVASYYYNSGFAWDPDNRLRESSYDLFSASAGWSAPSDAWGIRLWGRNLIDTQYCAYAAARPLLDSCSPAPPRTYGITFSTHLRP